MKKSLKLSALLCALAALAIALSGCGDKKDSTSGSANPATAVNAALKKASTITSGNANVTASIATGSIPPSFDISGGGPFDTKAKGGAAYDLALTVQVAGTDQKIGFVAVDGKNYISVGDQAVEQQQGAGGIDPSSISDFIDGLDKYLSNVKQIADKTVDGEALKVYTADLDLKALVDASSKSGGASNLNIPGLGSAKDIGNSVDTADVTIGVAADGFPHQLGTNIQLKSNSGGGVRATLDLTDINQPVTVKKPSNVTTDPSALGAFGSLLGAR